jgi:hypothetical protein
VQPQVNATTERQQHRINMIGKYVGQVTQWDDIRKFGFISTVEELPGVGNKVFIHHLNCIDDVFLGAFVQFHLGKPYKIDRPPQAVQVTIHVSAGLNALAKGIEPINGEVSEIGASIKAGV